MWMFRVPSVGEWNLWIVGLLRMIYLDRVPPGEKDLVLILHVIRLCIPSSSSSSTPILWLWSFPVFFLVVCDRSLHLLGWWEIVTSLSWILVVECSCSFCIWLTFRSVLLSYGILSYLVLILFVVVVDEYVLGCSRDVALPSVSLFSSFWYVRCCLSLRIRCIRHHLRWWLWPFSRGIFLFWVKQHSPWPSQIWIDTLFHYLVGLFLTVLCCPWYIWILHHNIGTALGRRIFLFRVSRLHLHMLTEYGASRSCRSWRTSLFRLPWYSPLLLSYDRGGGLLHCVIIRYMNCDCFIVSSICSQFAVCSPVGR